MSNTTIPQGIKDEIKGYCRKSTDGGIDASYCIKDATFGYSLAQSELEKLKAENLKLSSDLADAIRQRDMYQKLCELKSGH